MHNQIQSLPKYYQLKNILLDEMKGLPAGTALPSEKELMRKYNISYTTVYRTKLELLREGVINTVQGKGCFLSDLNKKGMNLNNHQLESKRIAVILPSSTDESYFHDILTSIMGFFQPRGYSVEVYNSNGDYSQESNLLGRCIINQIAGLIFIPGHYDGGYKHLLQLQKKRTPIVLINRHLKNYNLDWVGVNNIKASKKAVAYLIKSGHRQIAFLGYGKNNSVSQDRLEGYKQALRAKNIKIKPELILDCCANGIFGYEKFKKFISPGINFTAAFAFGDDIAIKAYQALTELKLKVPEDVSLIGFDDSEKARNFAVPLTTVRQDKCKLGYYAAKMLYKRIQNKKETYSAGSNIPERKTLSTKLVLRDSVKKIG